MSKFLALFVGSSVLGFAVLAFLFAHAQSNSVPTTAINEAVMDAMVAVEVADYATALELLFARTSQAFEQAHLQSQARNIWLLRAIGVYHAFFVAGFVLLLGYYQKRVIAPFGKLQDFAKNVARGDLDTPLHMDKHNAFGAFTESFDLLREELKTARENEREADRLKKELVATLSHDIKTPVAAIKATVELMQIRDHDHKTQHQLQEMSHKTEEITVLINDMFHSTLQELQVLSVSVTEFSSRTLAQLIQHADYQQMTKQAQIPDCILLGDTMRLGQVFDNILGNAYKYASTPIDVSAHIDDGLLVLRFRDYGVGVSGGELPLLFNKFYRGRDTAEVTGYGLGLYIVKHLLQEMGGTVELSNAEPGLVVQVTLRLA